jgi:hypothetical protein
LNRGKMLRILGDLMNQAPDQASELADLIARELKLRDKNISKYLADRKKDNISDDAIFNEVGQAIKLVVDKVIEELPIDFLLTARK